MRCVCRLALFWLLLAAEARAEQPIDYARDVKPLLARRCYACHGALKQQSGLRLDTAEAIRRGGEGGPAIEPGNSGESLLIDALSGANGHRQMPPRDEGKPLSAEEMALIRGWIDAGAVADPDEEPQPDPRRHWAFQRIERPTVPRLSDLAGSPLKKGTVPVGHADLSRENQSSERDSPLFQQAAQAGNPIDAFIAVEQRKRGLLPAAPASKPAILRRVYLDLTGLPPTREELHAFLADGSAEAYERVVDRLLESPRYGERWARHWMDVWRYSDWYGRRAVPDVWNSAPQVWRWRDWIVRSLNEDKGYDRMIMEMLAADEIAPEDEEAAVATGYIIRNWYALNPNQWMKDMVEHTGKAFLGLTLNCAHCHDHKYDPISNREYFAFRAFFEPVQVRQDWVLGEPDPGPFQKYEYTVLRKVAKHGSVRIFDENLAAETRMYRQGDERAFIEGKPPVAPQAPAFLGGDRIAIEPVELAVAAWYPGLKPFIQQAEIEKGQAALRTAREAFEKSQQVLLGAIERRAAVESQRRQALVGIPLTARQPSVLDPRLVDRLRDARHELSRAESSAKLAELQLATAQAQLDSIIARVAADRARYRDRSADADTLVVAASRAERSANCCAAAEKEAAAEEQVQAARLALESIEGAARAQAAAALEKADQQAAAARQGVEAAQKALAADSRDYSPIGPVYPTRSSGRRRALARWIASRDNPLTARVAVNHIWLRHFGRALVETPSDFGINGKAPSHPALLDWLAAELMEGTGPDRSAGSWKMKRVHRLIVTSQAYRAASLGDPQNDRLDPENRWLARFNPRRMEAEVVRDALLGVSGRLDPALGGPPLENDQELVSKRRSLYFAVHPEDGGHLKLLDLFDAPDPCDCYRRQESLVPQQALVMTNGPLSLECSRQLARRLWPESAGRESPAACRQAFVVAAFEEVLSRAPSSDELAACTTFLHRQQALFETAAPTLKPEPAPGMLPATTDPAFRAAENLVHALFNHNDFITIR